MLSVTEWIALAGICLLGAMTPGASLLVISRQALNGGYRAGLAASWAHAAGIGLWALLSAFGLAVILRELPALTSGLQVLAGIYLLWLAIQVARSGHHVPADQSGPTASQHRAALDGALISLLNPKVGLFFLALFSPLLGAEASSLTRLAAAALAAIIDGSWYTLVTFLMSRPAWRIRLRRGHPGLTAFTALAFAGFALLALLAPLR